jgi:8-oxo-dGTP pyrophosphatase MutT (NUDIX family)
MITRDWIGGDKIVPLNLHIRQVYCWIIDSKNKIIIVSKDGKHWQLPGGKPEKNESLKEALNREVFEECGITLSRYDPAFFGYYVVKGDEAFSNVDYGQARFFINLPSQLDNLKPGIVSDKESIKFVKLATIDELLDIMPWMSNAGEFEELKSFRKN